MKLKNIFKYSFLILLLFVKSCYASEYYIKEAGITFDVPEGFKVLTENSDNRDYFTIINSNKQDFIRKLKQENCVLLMYKIDQNQNNMMEIHVVYFENDFSKKVRDYSLYPNLLSNVEFKAQVKRGWELNQGYKVKNLSEKSVLKTCYVDMDAILNDNSVKSFSTIKNGAMYAFNGAIIGTDRMLLNETMNNFICSVKYDSDSIKVTKQVDDVKTIDVVNKHDKKSLVNRMLDKGVVTLALCVLALLIKGIYTFIKRKF